MKAKLIEITAIAIYILFGLIFLLQIVKILFNIVINDPLEQHRICILRDFKTEQCQQLIKDVKEKYALKDKISLKIGVK